MFTHNRLPPFQPTGDWAKDGRRLVKWLNDYHLSLERPDALAIVEYDLWTPVLTFATPGDLAVTYATQVGTYQKIGNLIVAQVYIITSAFTHTTASGALTITGLPFTSRNVTGSTHTGAMILGGVTKANYTNFCLSVVANSAEMLVSASGSGQTPVNIAAADMPTGGTVTVVGAVIYVAA